MHLKNTCVGKLSSQRYSLLIHLNCFETCTVLISRFLKNEMKYLGDCIVCKLLF